MVDVSAKVGRWHDMGQRYGKIELLAEFADINGHKFLSTKHKRDMGKPEC